MKQFLIAVFVLTAACAAPQGSEFPSEEQITCGTYRDLEGSWDFVMTGTVTRLDAETGRELYTVDQSIEGRTLVKQTSCAATIFNLPAIATDSGLVVATSYTELYLEADSYVDYSYHALCSLDRCRLVGEARLYEPGRVKLTHGEWEVSGWSAVEKPEQSTALPVNIHGLLGVENNLHLK